MIMIGLKINPNVLHLNKIVPVNLNSIVQSHRWTGGQGDNWEKFRITVHELEKCIWEKTSRSQSETLCKTKPSTNIKWQLYELNKILYFKVYF